MAEEEAQVSGIFLNPLLLRREATAMDTLLISVPGCLFLLSL